LRLLICESVENKIRERHGGVDDQDGVALSGLVLADMPIAHFIAETGQAADNADEAGEGLFKAVVDLRVVRREVEMLLNPLVKFWKIAVIVRGLGVEFLFDGRQDGLNEGSGVGNRAIIVMPTDLGTALVDLLCNECVGEMVGVEFYIDNDQLPRMDSKHDKVIQSLLWGRSGHDPM
jgi:hypothetical protein